MNGSVTGSDCSSGADNFFYFFIFQEYERLLPGILGTWYTKYSLQR